MDHIVGAVLGVGASIVCGSLMWWMRRSGDTRDRTGELGAKLAGLTVAVEHVGDDVRELKKDSKESFAAVATRFDRLPCHDFCLPAKRAVGG